LQLHINSLTKREQIAVIALVKLHEQTKDGIENKAATSSLQPQIKKGKFQEEVIKKSKFKQTSAPLKSSFEKTSASIKSSFKSEDLIIKGSSSKVNKPLKGSFQDSLLKPQGSCNDSTDYKRTHNSHNLHVTSANNQCDLNTSPNTNTANATKRDASATKFLPFNLDLTASLVKHIRDLLNLNPNN
jgi:hypothetical protein